VGVRLLLFALMVALVACAAKKPEKKEPLGLLPSAVTSAVPQWIPFKIRAGERVEADQREGRLLELRRLTTDGTSDAAAWHPDGRHLIYESGRSAASCGQLYSVDLGSGESRRISPEAGWASSGVVASGGTKVLFAFAETATPPCSPFGSELRWTLPHCSIVSAEQGAAPRALVQSSAYDAELSATPDGSQLVFTSMRDGDPELYLAAGDGSGVTRITDAPGYDGSARFSPDGAKLVWQAERLADDSLDLYKEQLASGQLMPRSLHIVLAGSRGQHPRVVAVGGRYNITPTFMPDSRRLLFASDIDDAPGADGPHNFELYLVDPDGPVTASGGPRLERITYFDGYDGSARLSPDGRHVVFTSSRLATKPGGTDLFIARWRAD